MRSFGWAAGWCVTLLMAAAVSAQPTSRPGAGERPAQRMEERVRAILNGLDLTADQKTKVDAIFKDAAEKFQSMRGELQGLDPRERMQRVGELTKGIHDQISQVLTETQRAEFDKKIQQAMQNFRGGPPTSGPAGGERFARGNGGPFGYFDKLRDNLAKLDLTDDQKGKIKDLTTELEQKGYALRKEIQNGNADARDKVREMFQDTRQKLAEILTPEQQQKLRDLMMSSNGGPAASRPAQSDAANNFRERFNRQRGAGANASTKSSADADKTMMDDKSMAMSDGEGAGNTKHLPKPSADAEKSSGGGAQVGDPAPQFSLRKLDGPNLQLSSLKGHVVVLEFGSWTSPAFRERAAGFEKLKNEFGSRASFFVVYTREAHAKGEWEIARNKDQEISVEQPGSLESRIEVAKKARQGLKITAPILLDSMSDETAKAYGAGANSAVVINRDGVIAAKQEWFDPTGLKHQIEDALKPTPSTAPSLLAH